MARRGRIMGLSAPQKRYPQTEQFATTANVGLPPRSGDAVRVGRLPLRLRHVPDSVQIVAYLNELAFQNAQDPIVRSAVVQILSANNIGNHDPSSAARALARFVKTRVVYVHDPEDAEYVISPANMLQNIAESGHTYGDCDDHVLLFVSMLKAMSIPAKVVGVSLDTPGRYDHVIASVKIHGQWRDLDLCAKDFVQPQYMRRMETL